MSESQEWVCIAASNSACLFPWWSFPSWSTGTCTRFSSCRALGMTLSWVLLFVFVGASRVCVCVRAQHATLPWLLVYLVRVHVCVRTAVKMIVVLKCVLYVYCHTMMNISLLCIFGICVFMTYTLISLWINKRTLLYSLKLTKTCALLLS